MILRGMILPLEILVWARKSRSQRLNSNSLYEEDQAEVFRSPSLKQAKLILSLQVKQPRFACTMTTLSLTSILRGMRSFVRRLLQPPFQFNLARFVQRQLH